MPATNTERIFELTRFVERLESRVASAEREAAADRARLEKGLDAAESRAKTVEELRIALAVTQNDLANLRKSADTWGTRIWGLGQVLGGAALGATVTYLLKR
jgi:hypothetical protein